MGKNSTNDDIMKAISNKRLWLRLFSDKDLMDELTRRGWKGGLGRE